MGRHLLAGVCVCALAAACNDSRDAAGYGGEGGDNGDVQIGTIEMSSENGHPEFVADTERPTTCVVRGARLVSRGNPVALFFRELTSNTRGNVQAIAEASIDFQSLTVPLWNRTGAGPA